MIIPRIRLHLGLAFGLSLGKLLGDRAVITVMLARLLHHGRARVIRQIRIALNAAVASRSTVANEESEFDSRNR